MLTLNTVENNKCFKKNVILGNGPKNIDDCCLQACTDISPMNTVQHEDIPVITSARK